MPTTPSGTSYAVLGLLNLRSWTTYELAQQVRRSLSWFWPRAERKLYQEPKLLVELGLATARTEHTGRRPRTVYTITPEGRAALGEWLDRPPAPRSAESEAMVKVFFADAGDLDQLRATLSHQGEEAVERIESLTAMAEASLEESAFPQRLHLSALSLRLQLEQELAVLRWTRWAREQVSQWESSTDPAGWSAPDSLGELVASARAALAEHSGG
jgi:DNA-binding PadR family transcriptional regulator